jgi:hypothetical protein
MLKFYKQESSTRMRGDEKLVLKNRGGMNFAGKEMGFFGFNYLFDGFCVGTG